MTISTEPVRVEYEGEREDLQGRTALGVNNGNTWSIQMDMYPGVDVKQFNFAKNMEKLKEKFPLEYLCFDWHEFPKSDWGEIDES